MNLEDWTDGAIHFDIFEYIKLWDTQYCGKAWFANSWRGKRWHQRRRIKRFWQ